MTQFVGKLRDQTCDELSTANPKGTPGRGNSVTDAGVHD